MQKIYSRINWENEPSVSTPLNEDNLNKIDYALDQVDTRVVNLYGYEERVKKSETNAKESEVNAKTSEINAKQSELLAQEYAEEAFKGTPEGYQEFLDKVDALEIKTTKERTIKGTKHGGFRLTKMLANTVQNGTPSPSTPVPLLSTGDCVEMIVGDRNTATGVYQPTWTDWRISKNPILCKAGDIVNATRVSGETLYCYYFNDTTYLSYGKAIELTGLTVPSGANNVYICVPKSTYNRDCKLTINGKYLGCAKTRPKNLIPKFKGMSGNANVQLTDWISVKPNTDYTLSFGDNSLVGTWYVVGSKDGTFLAREFSTDMQYTFNSGENNMIYLQVNNTPEITNGVTIPKLNKSAQLELGTVATEIVPCGETIAWYTTQYPMIKGSTLFRENGLVKAMHTMKSVSNSAEYLYDVDYTYNNVKYFCFIKPTDYMGYGNYGVYDVMSDKYIFDWHGNYGNNMDTTELIGKVISGADPNRFWVGYPIGATLAEVKTSGLFEVMYQLATPIIETLDTASQIALNGLETFKDVTYVEFDTRVQPLEFESEVGTSQVGAYTLKSLLNSESNAVKIEDAITTMLLVGA